MRLGDEEAQEGQVDGEGKGQEELPLRLRYIAPQVYI